MLIFYSIAQYTNSAFPLEIECILLIITGLSVYLLSMPLLNYITQRNSLSKKNTHIILLYAFLTAILPSALHRYDILIASFFLLMGFRRLLSLRNPKYIKNKILDASICVGIASLFYFWSILYIFLVFLSVFYFVSENYRHWIIPFFGLGIVYLFANCFTLIWNDSLFELHEYIAPISLSFHGYLTARNLFSIGIMSICMLFFLFIYLIKSKQKFTKGKPGMNLVIAHLLIGILMILITPQKDTSELLFITIPIAILGSIYLKLTHHRIVQEINIWVFLGLPFFLLLF